MKNMAIYNSYTDIELLALLKSGDKAAYTEIYNRFFGVLYVHAYKRLKDEEEAKDVIQEIFSALWIKRESIVPISSFSAYLYASVRNRIFDIIAHKQIESKYIVSLQHFINQGYCITDYSIREKDLASLIEKETSALPPKMREIFELSRKVHLSHKEIAEKLDLSEQTVRTQVKNSLRILRVKLGLLVYLIFLCNS